MQKVNRFRLFFILFTLFTGAVIGIALSTAVYTPKPTVITVTKNVYINRYATDTRNMINSVGDSAFFGAVLGNMISR